MTKIYAGIGSRSLTLEERSFCKKVGRWLAKKGWKLQTGAAKGTDQAFANGALSYKGDVKLCLPSPSYEYKWVELAKAKGADTKLLQYWHVDAWESVDKHHPKPWLLTNWTRSLQARNYLIVEGVKFVIAWPKGKWGGGTAQGIRIAEALGITVINLSIPEKLENIKNKIEY